MRRAAFARIAVIVSIGAIVLLLLSLSSSDSTTASHDPGNPQFNPTGDTRLCNGLPSGFPVIGGLGTACSATSPVDARSAAPGSHPDITSDLTIPAGHLNFAGLVTTLSAAFDIAPGTDHVSGTAMGGNRSTATLGLTNNPCDNTVFPDFVWWNSTIDISNVFNVSPEGTTNRFATLANVGSTVTGTGVNIAPSDANIVTGYPDFLNRMLDPDGSGDSSGGFEPVQPHARYAGLSRVPAGGEWQALQLLTFKPGELAAAFSAYPDNLTHPFTKLSADLGWTILTVLNDPTATVVSPNPITDFCTPLISTATVLGEPGGIPRITAPPAGTGVVVSGTPTSTHLAQAYAISQRDADLDGLENSLDTCPFAANMEDPYTDNGPDADMLDSACDPTPAINTNFGDHDGDVFLNAQDNCPIIANGGVDQKDSESTLAYVTAAPDGGPKGDSIGDACDPNNNLANGTFFFGFVNNGLCIGGSDPDNDGFCNSPTVSATTIDSDGDNFLNHREVFMNTDPLASCSLTSSHRAWPPDLDNNRTVNILDLSLLTPPVFGSSAGSPNYFKRRDLDANGTINILDLSLLTPPTFGSTCVRWTNQAFVSVRGNDVHVIAPPGAKVSSPTPTSRVISFTQATCRPEVAGVIWGSVADGDTVDTASAACNGGNTASVAPPAFGPVNAKSARAAAGGNNLTCTFQWTDAGDVNTRASFWCRG